MAAQNYSIYMADGGDKGSGPWTVTLRTNPTTVPAGGTLSKTVAADATKDLMDQVKVALDVALNANAQFWDVDPEN